MKQIKKLNKAQAVKLMTERFATIVGMTAAKARITQIILSALVDDYLPPIAIIATKGLGKTKLIMVLLSFIEDILGREVVWFPRGEDLGTRIQFVEKTMIPLFNDRDAVIGIDEVHEWKPNVQSFVRSLIEVTAERAPKTVRAIGDSEVTYDPLRNGFVIATNKLEKLDAPLLSRFEQIRLPLYSLGEMEQIVRLIAKKVQIKLSATAVKMIAEANRGTARDVVQWLDNVRSYLNTTGKKELDEKGALEVIKTREVFPQGVNSDELKTLLLLEKAALSIENKGGEMQLKELAGANGVTSAEQNANETFLRQKQFIRTRGTRSLTIAGAEYLKTLRKLDFIPELKKAGKGAK